MPLIEKVNGYDIIYNWFDCLTFNAHYINGYVIMPNHVHALISFSESEQSINTIIGNGKRFMAYEMIERLEQLNEVQLLDKLASDVKPFRKSNKNKHAVWEFSFDWKYCLSIEFSKPKLNYMHMNPNRGKWNLCINPIDYLHSSAKYYLTGEQGIYPVTNIMQMQDIDLMRKNI